MTPRSFDVNTAKEIVGDERCRTIEKVARESADNGEEMPKRPPASGSYWSQVRDEMEYRVLVAAYQRRLDRIERMTKGQTA